MFADDSTRPDEIAGGVLGAARLLPMTRTMVDALWYHALNPTSGVWADRAVPDVSANVSSAAASLSSNSTGTSGLSVALTHDRFAVPWVTPDVRKLVGPASAVIVA